MYVIRDWCIWIRLGWPTIDGQAQSSCNCWFSYIAESLQPWSSWSACFAWDGQCGERKRSKHRECTSGDCSRGMKYWVQYKTVTEINKSFNLLDLITCHLNTYHFKIFTSVYLNYRLVHSLRKGMWRSAYRHRVNRESCNLPADLPFHGTLLRCSFRWRICILSISYIWRRWQLWASLRYNHHSWIYEAPLTIFPWRVRTVTMGSMVHFLD